MRLTPVCDCHQPLDRRIVQRTLCDLAVEQFEILRETVELADMPLDRSAFVVGDRLTRQPGPAAPIEQIRVRALRDQMRVQDRVHLVFEPRPVAHHLVAPGHQPAQPLGRRVRRPDLRQIARRMEARQRPRVDLVGLHMGVRDSLHLQRIGDHNPFYER